TAMKQLDEFIRYTSITNQERRFTMSLINRISHWSEVHHIQWREYLRIFLGIIILAKGVSFVADREAVRSLIEQTNFQLYIWGAVHYVVFTPVVGGLFIIMGFLTRLALVFLLAMLISSVFFVKISRGFSLLNSVFWLSLIVMILLILIVIW